MLGGAEIISIDAYNKSDTGDGFVIGITILKVSTDTSIERYLNIYTEGAADGEGDEASSIEAIAQNCLMVELAYTPYHLYHTVLPQQNSQNEVIFCIKSNSFCRTYGSILSKRRNIKKGNIMFYCTNAR